MSIQIPRKCVEVGLFFLIYLAYNVSQVFAVASVDQEPEHKGPYYSYPITSNTPTADQYDCPSARCTNFLLHAFVQHIDKGTLFAQLMGNEEFKKEVHTFGKNDIISIAPKRNVSFGTDNKIYDLLGSGDGDTEIVTGLADYITTLSKNEDNSPSFFVSTCLYLGIPTPTECAKTLHMTFKNAGAPGGESINRAATSNFMQKMTTIRQQTSEGPLPVGLYTRAQQTKQCGADGAGNDLIFGCGNKYYVTPTGATSDLEFAQQSVLNVIPAEGVSSLDIPPQTLFKNLGLAPNKTSENFYVVFRPDPENATPLQKISYIVGFNQPVIVRGYIPGLPTLAKMIVAKAKLLTTQKNGDRIDQLFKKKRDNVPVGKTIEEQLLNLVKDSVGDSCGEVSGKIQNRGSNSTSNVHDAFDINFGFNIVGGKPYDPETPPPMPVYCAYLVGPVEMEGIQALFSWAPDALTRKYFTLAYAKNFVQKEENMDYIPQPISDLKKVRTVPKDVNCHQTDEVVDCGKGVTGVCYKTECDQVYIAYNKGTDMILPTGSQDRSDGAYRGQVLTRLQAANRWKYECYWDNVKTIFDADPSKQQLISRVSAKVNSGSGLSAIMGTESLGLASNPNCRLSYIPDYSGDPYNTTPPNDMAICDVAKKYNVPCEYLKGIWFVESNNATGCTALAINGPMEITDGAWTLLDPGHKLDRCNLSDSWELAARLLLVKKYGNWESGIAGGIAYSTDPSSRDLQTTGQYNGVNNCDPNLITQCRWGKGVSYCDAVLAGAKGGYPSTWQCTISFCQEYQCDYVKRNPGLTPAPIDCNGTSVTGDKLSCGSGSL